MDSSVAYQKAKQETIRNLVATRFIYIHVKHEDKIKFYIYQDIPRCIGITVFSDGIFLWGISRYRVSLWCRRSSYEGVRIWSALAVGWSQTIQVRDLTSEVGELSISGKRSGSVNSWMLVKGRLVNHCCWREDWKCKRSPMWSNK